MVCLNTGRFGGSREPEESRASISYYTIENTKRVHKTLTFDGAFYKTERAFRQHLESFVLKLNDKTEYAPASEVTFGALLDRYMAEEMPPPFHTQRLGALSRKARGQKSRGGDASCGTSENNNGRGNLKCSIYLVRNSNSGA
jgi:hypothetical protein